MIEQSYYLSGFSCENQLRPPYVLTLSIPHVPLLYEVVNHPSTLPHGSWVDGMCRSSGTSSLSTARILLYEPEYFCLHSGYLVRLDSHGVVTFLLTLASTVSFSQVVDNLQEALDPSSTLPPPSPNLAVDNYRLATFLSERLDPSPPPPVQWSYQAGSARPSGFRGRSGMRLLVRELVESPEGRTAEMTAGMAGSRSLSELLSSLRLVGRVTGAALRTLQRHTLSGGTYAPSELTESKLGPTGRQVASQCPTVANGLGFTLALYVRLERFDSSPSYCSPRMALGSEYKRGNRVPTLFVKTEAPLPPKVRGLSSDLAREADEAVADGLRRDAPNTDEVIEAIDAIKRYLNQRKFTVRVVYNGDMVSWQAVPMKERPPMSDEHKAKLQASLKAHRERKAREKKAAEKAAASAK